MLRRSLLASALLLVALIPAPARPADPALPKGLTRVTSVEGVTEYRLANGLKILLIPDRSIDTVTVNVTYLVGSRHEGYGETGMAHLLEHLMFRGTPRFPSTKADFQRHGARYNGSTSFDRTNYYETFPASEKTLDHVLDVEADRMVNASIARRDLDAEMTVVRNEFEAGENSAFGVLRERVAASAYLWHNYGNAIIGARSDIENVPIERLRAFYSHYYQPDNCARPIPSSRPRTASARSRCGARATCSSSRRSTICLRGPTPNTPPWTCWSRCSITCLRGGCTRRSSKPAWRAPFSAPSGSSAKPASPTSART
jgi:zinc protease